jgi:hypothetical protein
MQRHDVVLKENGTTIATLNMITDAIFSQAYLKHTLINENEPILYRKFKSSKKAFIFRFIGCLVIKVIPKYFKTVPLIFLFKAILAKNI